MNTIHMPCRPPGYLARQGYVKPLWLVKLRRSDTKRNYVPDDEAYNLPAVKEKLESDKYSVSTIDRLTLELTRTDELVDFLGGLADPKRLSIKIYSYLIFRKRQKQLVWFGQLQNLPEGTDAYPWDKLKLTFTSPPGAWEDGDEVKDPDTKTWYKNKHVKDLLLPKFLKKAFEQAGPGGGRKYKIDEPTVKGADYFWSGSELPRKKLAVPSALYDDTYQVKSLCWDSARKLLYLGVWSSHSSKNPWLVSYDPATRRWTKLCRFKYAGPRDWRELPAAGWEVLHLEYDAATDKVWYVCQTRHGNLCDPRAHYKCFGHIDMTSVPDTVDLVGANLFTLHNKGFAVRSKPIFYHNFVQGGDYAYGLAQTIGWGTPKAEKECGAMHIAERYATTLYSKMMVPPGSHMIPIPVVTGDNRPRPGDFCEVHDEWGNKRQSFGEVINVGRGPGDKFLYVKCEKHARYPYVNFTEPTITHVNVYFYKPAKVPAHNVFVAKPQKVVVEFLHADGALTGLNAPDPVDVVVEHKHYRKGREQFYWPRKLGEISEDGESEIDVTGFVSFNSMRDLSLYKTEDEGEGETKHYWAWNPAPFRVTFAGYHASFLLADGFTVRSGLQDHGGYGPYTQPGKCRLVKDGKTCEVTGHGPLETYGDIFLFKRGSRIYAAWNDHDCDKTYNQYPQCKVAVWEEAKGRFRRLWVNREGSRWWEQDVESYITSATRYQNRFYFGRRHYGRNWIDTGVKVFWAAPPQTNMGASAYDGGIVAMAAVKGDKTEVFEAGDVIRFYAGPGASPGLPGKEYVISEVQTFEREIVKASISSPWMRWPAGPTGASTDYLAEGEELPYRGQVTLLSVLSIEPYMEIGRTYSEQIGCEIRGKYISVAKGRDERYQIMELKR